MSERRTLLVVLPDDKPSGELISLLSEEYELIVSHNHTAGFKLLTENLNVVSGVIVDITVARSNGFVVIKYISSDSLFASVPVVLVSQRPPSAEDFEGFSYGYSEFIYPPCKPAVMLRRIKNAIGAKDTLSFSELERVLKELPSIIYLKDRDGRYVFVSQSWYQKHEHDERGWTVRGKTELDIRIARENALVAMETDKRVIETGEGISYVVEEHEGDKTEFFEVIKRATHDRSGEISGIVALVNNVTNHQLLKRELEKRSKTDPLTGLLNKRATEEVMGRLLEKPEPNVLMIIDVDRFKSVNDTYGHAAGDRVLASIGKLIRSKAAPADIIGRVGGDEFMVLLRGADEAKALASANALREAVEESYPASSPVGRVTLSIGLAAALPGEENSFLSMYKAADRALYFVKEHGRNGAKMFE